MTGYRVSTADVGHWFASQRRDQPAYQALAQAVRQAVLDGRLPPGSRLPSERDLASALKLSRITVTGAYAHLKHEGFLITSRGAPGVVSLPKPFATSGGPVTRVSPLGNTIDLAHSSLPAPGPEVVQAFQTAIEHLGPHLGTPGYAPLGLDVLREAVAARFTRRGLPTQAEQVLVTSGGQQAMHLILRTLAFPGDRVVVEQPSYPHAMDAMTRAGCRIVSIPLHNTGWSMPAFTAAFKQTSPRLAYVIPDFQNPTGLLMPEADRALLARAAMRTHTTLIVDESFTELALDTAPPTPVAALAPRADILTVGSLSKPLWAGLRIGWIRGPTELIERLGAGRVSMDLGSPVLEQIAAALLICRLDDILPDRHALLRSQRRALADALTGSLPDWRFTLPAGGLNLWVTLPRPLSSALAFAAETRGVALVPGSRFAPQGPLETFLRLPFVRPQSELQEGVERLTQAYAQVSTRPGAPAGHRQVVY